MTAQRRNSQKYERKNKLIKIDKAGVLAIKTGLNLKAKLNYLVRDEKGDVPGWVLVVLMTTGLVTAIWTIAAPKLTSILRNSLDAMNGVH